MMKFATHIDENDLLRVHHLAELPKPAATEVIRSAAAFAHASLSMNAPGAIARSFESRVTGLSARISSSLPEARPVEYGRHPGSAFPPPSALKNWAASHGLEGLEFVIARAIARRGIKGRFFKRRTVERLHQQELPRLLRRAGAEIEKAFAR